MIEIKRVSKVYRLKDREVVAVDDVSLTIEDGDIYGIIGYSGAGKSKMCIRDRFKRCDGDISDFNFINFIPLY